jgi:uncharacterized protein YbaR (Trm112 family)
VIDSELMKILCCPETHQGLRLAEGAMVGKLNQQIATGQLRNRAGATVKEPMEGGLVRDDGKYIYPVRGNLPIMLVDEAIELTAQQGAA